MRSTARLTRRGRFQRERRSAPPGTSQPPAGGAKARADGARSAVLGPVVAPQEIGAELVEARAADLAHDQVDFVAEDVNHLLDTGNPACDGAIERRPAEKDELRAKAPRDQDVGAAPHPAVE